MTFDVKLTRTARKEIAAVPFETERRIVAALEGLAGNPRPPGCLKLSGRDGWRIRIGDYRVLYVIDDSLRSVIVT